MKQKRAERIMEALKKMGLRQMLIVDPMSIYYLTGVYMEPFERLHALYLKEDGKHMYFLNKLFTVPEDVGVEKVWYSDTDSAAEIVTGHLDKESPLGVGKDLRTRFLLPLMEMEIATGFVNPPTAVGRTRGVKDEEEQDKIRTASDINNKAMAVFKTLIHEGVTERQVADQMPKIYMGLGADGFSFKSLVVFRANAADPHHGPDGTVIRPGDSVLLGVGCIKDGYCSNMIRTFYFRKASDEHHRIYETARSANETAISKIRPSAPLCELDRAARDLIAEQGYEPFLTHRLGHFIGLEEHESGDVSSMNTQKTEPGMMFSIEPGIYLPGDTGVRMEDLVLVTEDGCEVLNHYFKEFEMIGSSVTG